MARDTVVNNGIFDIPFLLKNTAVCMALSVGLIFLASCGAVFLSLSDIAVAMIVGAISDICVGICGFKAARHFSRQGLLSGILTGIFYILAVYLIGSIVFGNFGISSSALLSAIIRIICGAIGGIIGVNSRRKKHR